MNPGVTSTAPPLPAITATTPFSACSTNQPGPDCELWRRTGGAGWTKPGSIPAVDKLLKPIDPLVDGAEFIAASLRLLVERGSQRSKVEFAID